jgi:hypothetical protein
MSADASAARGRGAIETLAGLLAAASIAVSLVALAYRPFRIAPFAIALAIVAAGMGGRHSRLAYAAVIVGAVCWFAGMIVAIVTNNPVF